MPLELQIREREGTTRAVPLDGGRLTLGRSHDNDLAFASDASLSRHHLVFEEDAEGWTVRDLESKNGTLLNGVRIQGSRRMRAGDKITAGHLVLLVNDPNEEPTQQSVEFFAGADDGPSTDTVMTSLQDVLSGEQRVPAVGPTLDQTKPSPGSSRRLVGHPAVSALLKAGRELAGHRPINELFGMILNLANEAVGAERGVLMTIEKGELVPRAVHGEGFRISTRVRDRVINDKASVLVRDTTLDEAFKTAKSISEQNIRTMMAVPLQTEERVIGLIYVDSRMLTREFTPDDLELLTVLANHAAIRIEHERLAEVERQEQIMTRDLNQAATIQQSFLPLDAPAISGAELAGHNAASRTVGGDYYDFFTYDDGGVAFVLGDVAGKGMPAALIMSKLQACCQMLAEEGGEVADLVQRLDRIVAGACPTNRFISLFYAHLHPSTGQMTYTNAGHNPPILIRSSGQVELLEGGGTVLGIMPEIGYEQRACQMEPGDICAVFSDGVTEAASPDDEEFGEERLTDLLVAARNKPLEEVLDLVNRSLAEFTAGTPQADDITLVIVRRT
jgi:serine phosphatase RsbU (regulator of sigma subunit)